MQKPNLASAGFVSPGRTNAVALTNYLELPTDSIGGPERRAPSHMLRWGDPTHRGLIDNSMPVDELINVAHAG